MTVKKIFGKWLGVIKKNKRVALIDHTIVVTASAISGLLLYLLITTLILPQHIPLPETTAINWLTVHQHSLTLDYIRFGIFVLIVPLSILSGWILFLWKKGR